MALPGVWRLGIASGALEVKAFFRDKMAVAFIFGLPSILLVLLGSIFGGQAAAHGVTVGQLFTAGMIAGGIMSTSFQYLAISIATERENGMLKRLSGTPMPRAAYFAGKFVQVLMCTVAETVLLMAVGIIFYHLHLPISPGRWWTFAWVFLLGTAAGCLTQNESVPKATNIEVNGKRKAADPEKVGWTLDRKPRLFALRGAGRGRRAAQVLLHLGRRQRASGARAGNVDQVIEAQPP